MSLYSSGIITDLPTATVVPGLLDPRIFKLEDVAVPGGRKINMADYAADPAQPVLEQRQVGVKTEEHPLKQLGDSIHFDAAELKKRLTATEIR